MKSETQKKHEPIVPPQHEPKIGDHALIFWGNTENTMEGTIVYFFLNWVYLKTYSVKEENEVIHYINWNNIHGWRRL